MRMYQLEIPTKIYFGREIAFQALAEEKDFLSGNVLIVTTGRSLNRLGYVEKLKKELRNLPNVKSVAIYDQISANPQLQEITKAAEEGKENRTDIVVGFGGGSAIDAAKAVAAVIGTGNSVETFFYRHIEPDERTLPVVAIPTTAGTGSELSKAAILSDYEKHKKGGVRGKNLYPKLAIVDSVFTETVPLHITMETGFDVLAHAIESYVSKAASPFTKILSEQVISTAGKALMELEEDIQNKEAREKMSYASMIMGINLGNASTAMPHRLQYPLGAYTKTSHGSGLAAIYPTWIYYEYTVNSETIRKVLEQLTGKEPANAEQASGLMKDFLKQLQLPVSIRELGVKENMLSILAEDVSGNLANDPLAETENIIYKIYERAMKE